jgi:hypothetical protein
MKAKVWKLRWLRREIKKGTCLLCVGNEDIKTYMSFPQRVCFWRLQLKNWLGTNKEQHI